MTEFTMFPTLSARCVVLTTALILFSPAARGGASGEDRGGEAFRVHLEKGWKHLEKNRYENAIEELEAALALSEGPCQRCLRGIALSHFRLKRYEDSVAAYEKLFELDPGSSIKLLGRLVWLYDLLGTPEKAVPAYKRFLESSHRRDELITAYNELGYRLLTPETGVETHRGDAAQAFRSALDLAGGNSNLLRRNLAEALLQLNLKDEARSVLEGLDPAHEDSWASLQAVEASPWVKDNEAEVRATWARPIPAEPIYVSGDVRPPEKIHAPQPQYTELARKARIQGVVIVQTIIDRKGNVIVLKVLKGLSSGLTEEAVKAMSEWKFKPATLNGEPVSVYYNLTVSFRLQ